MTLQEIEIALDEGRVECNMANGRWWKARRNGKTKQPKRNPSWFEIPIKAGFRSHGYITPDTLNAGWYRIVPPKA